MLEKIARGADTRGLLVYLLGQLDHTGEERPRVAVIGGPISSGDVHTMMAQYNALQRLRPNLTRSLTHCSLRSAPGDRMLTDQEWAWVGRKWAEAMGYSAYTVVRHDHRHGDHIHIVASRVNPDGVVVPDAWDFRRSEVLVRAIESQLDIRQVVPSHLLVSGNAMTESIVLRRRDIQQALEGERVYRVEIAAAINRALVRGPIIFTDFVAALKMSRITVRPRMSPQFNDLLGLSFALDGVALRGSKLGKGYSVCNLFRKGLSYSFSRDQRAIRDCLDMVTLPVAAGSKGFGRDDEADPYFASDLP